MKSLFPANAALLRLLSSLTHDQLAALLEDADLKHAGQIRHSTLEFVGMAKGNTGYQFTYRVHPYRSVTSFPVFVWLDEDGLTANI